jgi:hypothetical protein
MDAPLRKIELRGSPRERGRIHGETLRPLVREHLERWREALVADLGVEPDAYVHEFLRDTNFLPAIERWTPRLLEELRGIAEGAGTDFRYTFVRALSDEEPWYRRERKLAAMTAKGCTSLGADARDGRPTVIAQNMDMPGWCDGHQVLLHVIDPSSPVEVFAFTVAGKISLCGMNSAGLGMCCNTLSQLDYARDGLPEDFVVRGFLERASLAAGLEFLRTVPHASGQNYTVAGPGSPAINLECSAGAVAEFRPPQCGDRVYHTNHPIANRDQDTFRASTAGLTSEQLEQLYYGTSHPRLAAIERSFGNPATLPTVEGMKAALSSHQGPVCRHGEREGRYDHFTLGCLVMELGARPRLHVAPGPPCRTDFQVFSFAEEK